MNDLLHRYRQDPFLSKKNELPLLDERLEALSRSVLQYWQRTYQQAKLHLDSMTRRLGEIDNRIGDANDKIPGLIRNLTASLDPINVPSYATVLENLYKELYRVVHPEVRVILEELARERQSLLGKFDDLNEAYRAAISSLPESITLVSRRDYQPVSRGVSIIEMESSRWGDGSNSSPVPLVNRIGMALHVGSVKRLYRVADVRPVEIALECLQGADRLKASSFADLYDGAFLDATGQFDEIWGGLRQTFYQSMADLEDLHRSFRSLRADSISRQVSGFRDRLSEALAMSRGQITDLRLPYAKVLEDLNAAVINDVESFVQCVHLAALASSHPHNLRMRLRSWLGDHLLLSISKVFRGVGSWTSQLDQAPAYVRGRLGDLVSLVRAASGSPASPEEALLAVTELPSQSQLKDKLDQFPAIYRRLFSYGPLDTRELLVGCAEKLQIMSGAYREFDAGAALNLAVVGPKGSGKTSLLKCFVEELGPAVPVSWHEIARRLRTEAELIEALTPLSGLSGVDSLSVLVRQLQRLPRQVVILEGGDNLFLRTVGTREALEAFLQVMMSTRENLMWCVSFQGLPWQQMDHVLDLGRYFTYQLWAGAADQKELEQALMLRVSQSELKPVFLTEGGEPTNGASQTPDVLPSVVQKTQVQKTQKAVQDGYFRDLFRVTGGYMAAAMYFWQVSSVYVEAVGELRIYPCVKLNYRILQSLERIHIFTVAELLKHGSLSIEEHSEIFNVDARESQLILGYLRQLPLVGSTPFGAEYSQLRYEINPVYYHHVASYLSSINILH